MMRKGRRRGKVEIVEDRPGKEGLEGVGVGAVNVYLVVFKDGIISVSPLRRGGNVEGDEVWDVGVWFREMTVIQVD